LFYLFCHFPKDVSAPTQHGHFGACAAQSQRNGPPDAGSSPGYNRFFAL
jgi:hypothetical protein